MKCQHCGAELSDNSVFCNICGKSVGEEEPKTVGKHHRRTVTHEKTHTTQRHRTEKKHRHSGEDDARYDTISFEKPKPAADRRADWERSIGDDKRYDSLAFDLPEVPASAPEAPAAGRASELNLNLGEAEPAAPLPNYAGEAPHPYPEDAVGSSFKKSQKKTTALWISVIALLLVIAIVTGAVFIISRGKMKDASHESASAPAATEPAYVDADVRPDDPGMNDFLTDFITGTYTPAEESNDEAKEAEQKEENNSREASEANGSPAAVEEAIADREENAKAASVNDPSVNVEYDCRAAAGGSANLLEAIMNEPSCINMTPAGIENDLYPIDGYTSNSYELVYIPSDWESLPDGLESGLGEVRSYKAENINWICKNIFNLSDADIDALYNEANSSHKIWKSRNGTEYMTFISYDSTPVPACTVSVSEVKMSPDGAYYYVKYNVVSENQTDSFYAVLGKSTIEGKEYWTMYRNTDDVPADIEPFSMNN